MFPTPDVVRQTLFNRINEMQANSWLYSVDSRDFTRNRKISFSDTILSTISMQRSSQKAEVLKYFDFSSDAPSHSALIQRRNKVPADSFAALFYSFTNSFSLDLTLKGYDPIAVDGSDIQIPRNPKDPDTYRISDPYNKGFNMLHLNAAYHLLSHLYLDVILQPINQINEYTALCDMIDHYAVYHPSRKPLFIADRGYSSLNVFAHAIENDAFFLIRAREVTSNKSRSLLSTIDLPDSDEYDFLFDRFLSNSYSNSIKSHPDIYKYVGNRPFDYLDSDKSKLYHISFRIVRFRLPNGQSETVFTNLPSEDFSISELRELYRMRWGIETSFRDIKYSAGLLFFHSRKKELVLQEIFAKLILYNYCELITQSIVVRKNTSRKYSYQINFSIAVAICIEYLKRFRKSRKYDVVTLISRELIPIRPNRSSPRYIRARTASTFQYR